MFTAPEVILFRGAQYRLALTPEVRGLLTKRKQMLDLISSLGVPSAAEELTVKYQKGKGHYEKEYDVPFLPLSDGRPFTALVYEMINRAEETELGETPPFYADSPEELQVGLNDALTGRLIPVLKQIRQIFDELKQHPSVLRPRDFLREVPKTTPVTRSKPHSISPQEREQETRMQQEFLKGRGVGARSSQFIKFRGALYRLATKLRRQPSKAYQTLRALAVGESGGSQRNVRSAARRLRDHLFHFRTSYQETALAAAEQAAQELLSLSEEVVSQLRKVMDRARELKKEQAEEQLGVDPVQKEEERARKKELIHEFHRLKQLDFIDPGYLKRREYPADLDPRTLSTLQLEELLEYPREEERDAIDRAYRRMRNLKMPSPVALPKRKIWKETEEAPESKPKPRGRPRKIIQPTPPPTT